MKHTKYYFIPPQRLFFSPVSHRPGGTHATTTSLFVPCAPPDHPTEDASEIPAYGLFHVLEGGLEFSHKLSVFQHLLRRPVAAQHPLK